MAEQAIEAALAPADRSATPAGGAPPWRIPLCVGILVFLVGLPILGNGVTWDEHKIVDFPAPYLEFRHLPTAFFGPSSKLQALGAPSDIYGTYYRPLEVTHYAACSFLFGTKPFGWAFVALALHALAASLLSLWLVACDAPWLLAFLAGLIFGIHPLGVGSPAFIGVRPDLWIASCLFLSLTITAHGFGAPNTAGYLTLIFAIALGFKEMAVLIPIVVILMGFVRGFRPNFKQLLRIGFLHGAFIVLYLLVRSNASLSRFEHSQHLSLFEYFTRVAQSCLQLIFIGGSYIFPDNLGTYGFLDLEHRTGVLTGLGTAANPMGNAALILTTGAVVIALACFLRGWSRIGLLGFLAACLPVLKLVPVYSLPFELADRHLYVPSFGLAILAASLLTPCLQSPRRGLKWGAVALILMWIAFGWRRERALRDDPSFFDYECRLAPESFRLHENLCHYYMRTGIWTGTASPTGPKTNPELALKEIRLSVALNPEDTNSRRVLVEFLYHRKDCAAALTELRALRDLNPHYLLHQPHLCSVFDECGAPAEANALLIQCVEHSPTDPAVHETAGNLLLRHHSVERARAAYMTSLSLAESPRLRALVEQIDKHLNSLHSPSKSDPK